MKLGINGWRLHGQRTGVGRYLLNTIKHWTPEVVAGRFDEINLYTPEALDRRDSLLPENIREQVLTPNWRMLVWENLRLAPVAADDIVFHPSFSRPLAARGKTVVTMHEAAHYIHPELFPKSQPFYNRLYTWSGRHATLVIAGSETSRHDIAKYCGIPFSQIRVTRLAPAEFFKPIKDDSLINEVQKRFIESSAPFFLTVGKMSGRRNFPRLLEAFAEFKQRTSLPHKLLLVGLNIHNIDIAGLITRLGITDHVKEAGYVSDEDLNLIYNAAEAFISPSVYETLCLPVMEAQAAGVPVICIDTAGMQEITSGTALLIPKLEVLEIVNAMSKLANESALRQELVEAGLANSKRFSWKRCALDTLAVLEEAAYLPS